MRQRKKHTSYRLEDSAALLHQTSDPSCSHHNEGAYDKCVHGYVTYLFHVRLCHLFVLSTRQEYPY